MTVREQNEFYQRLEGVKIAFPLMEEVQIIEDAQKVHGLCVGVGGKDINMKLYSKVMIVGNKVININCNSVSANIEIICKINMYQDNYIGFIGYLY